MKMSFHSLATETHFHFKGITLDLALKQRLQTTPQQHKETLGELEEFAKNVGGVFGS